MRLLVAFAVTYYISIFPVFAENTVTPPSSPIPAIKSPLASKALLLDISLISEDKLVAVGQHGHILLSSNGEDWQQANVPVQTTLTKIFFLNDQLGWAVGHDATILHTEDGGLNWVIQQYLPLLQKPLFDIFFQNTKEGMAVGAYGQVFRTKDGGNTWQNEFHQELLLADDLDYINELKAEDEAGYLDEISFILPHFNGIVKDGEKLFLLGETGLLATSIDFGVTWKKIENFYQGSFFALARISKDKILITGLRGHIFTSLDNGQQWSEVLTKTTALLNDIVFANDGRIFVLGNNGMLLVSDDNGQSFSKQPQLDGKTLIAGTWFKNKLIVVSDVGIKVINVSH